MNVTVTAAPDPIVSWEEANVHLRLDGDTDQKAYVESLIAVATAWLDGPDGWLGRALGLQELQAVFPADLPPVERRYPLPPFRAVLSELSSSDGRSVTVRWRAGYEAGKLPAPVRHAILLMVSHLFNNRDAVSTSPGQPTQLPLGVESLLAPLRVWG